MISRRTLGWIIGAWTLISWGGRIGLLTDADAADFASWARIGGSIVIGLATAVCFIAGRFQRPMSVVFALWTVFVWVRSLVTVWTEPNSLAFQLVHTALAVVWFALAVGAVKLGQPTGSATEAGATGVPGGTISDSFDTTSSIDR